VVYTEGMAPKKGAPSPDANLALLQVFDEYLASIRESERWLCCKAKVPYNTIGKIRRGEQRSLELPTLAKLAAAMHWPLDDLIARAGLQPVDLRPPVDPVGIVDEATARAGLPEDLRGMIRQMVEWYLAATPPPPPAPPNAP
jgi:hypothetical protein